MEMKAEREKPATAFRSIIEVKLGKRRPDTKEESRKDEEDSGFRMTRLPELRRNRDIKKSKVAPETHTLE